MEPPYWYVSIDNVKRLQGGELTALSLLKGGRIEPSKWREDWEGSIFCKILGDKPLMCKGKNGVSGWLEDLSLAKFITFLICLQLAPLLFT